MRAWVAIVVLLGVTMVMAEKHYTMKLNALENRILDGEFESQIQTRDRKTNCPNDCSRHGTCYGRTCNCDAGYAGDDCSIYDKALEWNKPVVDTVGIFEWKFYHIAVNSSVGGIIVHANQTSRAGDCDLYIQRNTFPTLSSYIARDISLNRNTSLVVLNSGQATYYAGVYGFFGCSFDMVVVPTNGCPNDCSGHGNCTRGSCQCEVGWSGTDCGTSQRKMEPGKTYNGDLNKAQWASFNFDITAGQGYSLTLSHGNNQDCDLFARFGKAPTLYEWDYSNDTTSIVSEIRVPRVNASGTWHVGVFAFTRCQFSLTFALTRTENSCGLTGVCSLHGTCTNGACVCRSGFTGELCENSTNSLVLGQTSAGFVETNLWNHYNFRVNTAEDIVLMFHSESGGDIDVYVKQGQPPTRFDFDFFDINTDSSFNITIDDGGSASWHVGIFGWIGAHYNFTLITQPPCQQACVHGRCSSQGQCVCETGYGGVSCEHVVTSLTSGFSTSGRVAISEWHYFSLEITNSSQVYINLREKSTTGFLWVFASYGALPDSLVHDFSEKSIVPMHDILGRFPNRRTGTVYIGVQGSPYLPQSSHAEFELVTWSPHNF